MTFAVGALFGAGVAMVAIGLATGRKWEELERENMVLRGRVFGKIPGSSPKIFGCADCKSYVPEPQAQDCRICKLTFCPKCFVPEKAVCMRCEP